MNYLCDGNNKHEVHINFSAENSDLFLTPR